MQKETIDLIYNIIGISGVSMILVAYGLLQIDKINKRGFLYSFLNLLGSVLMFISLLRFWNLASVIIEIFWISISIYGLYKWKRLRSGKRKDV